MNLKRKILFSIFSLAIVLLFIALLEIFLSTIQPGFLQKHQENLNPAGLPYFFITESDGYQILTPSRYFQPYQHDFKMVMPKPKGVFRIFLLGESTTRGHPFFNPGAHAEWLNQALIVTDPTTQYEVINSGQGSFPSSEILGLTEQIVTADPDLLVFYVGNNEFFYNRDLEGNVHHRGLYLKFLFLLDKSMAYKAMKALVKTILPPKTSYDIKPESMQKHAVYFLNNGLKDNWDRDHRDQVLGQYRKNLEKMVSLAKSRNIKVLLCTIGVNLRNWEPYGSYHKQGFAESLAKAFDELVQKGREAFAAKDYNAALDFFTQASTLDDAPAEINYYLGYTLLKLGRNEEARAYFQKAVDNDPFRDRAGSDTNALIRTIGQSNDIPIVDVEELFKSLAPDGIPGDDLFVDFVHPTLDGHKMIAQAILQTMIDQGWVHPVQSWQKRLKTRFAAYSEKMPAEYLFRSYYTAASMNAFMGRFDHAMLWVDKALEYSPNDLEGLYLKKCLQEILKQRKSDPSLPWGEVEFARDQKL